MDGFDVSNNNQLKCIREQHILILVYRDLLLGELYQKGINKEQIQESLAKIPFVSSDVFEPTMQRLMLRYEINGCICLY